MLPCNSFASNTILQTQQAVGCVGNTYDVAQMGIDPIQGLLAILDMLQRANIGPSISAIPGCDVFQAMYNAQCAITPLSTPGDADPQKILGLIFVKLNAELC